MKLETPRLESQDGTGISKDRRHCRCKQSKCLKLYCECFASGLYCDGCSCVYCCNNTENEAITRLAAELILGRNPNAFRPKIASSPCNTQADSDGNESKNFLIIGKHKKGCKCKKTGCLKNYCECFRANIICSENCKCTDCKNPKVREQGTCLSLGSYGNSQACVKLTNAATGSIGNKSPQETRKRKLGKILDSDEKDQEIHKLGQGQRVNPVRISGSFPTFSVDLACCNVSSTALGFSKFAYRSLLTDVTHPLDTRELCSLLVVVSEAAKILTAEMQEEKDNRITTIVRGAQDGKNKEKEPDVQKVLPDKNLSGNQTDMHDIEISRYGGTDIQEGRSLLPQENELMCNEEENTVMGAASPIQDLNHGFTAEFYLEQERFALTCLRDCLAKLSTFGIGTIKAAELSKPELK